MKKLNLLMLISLVGLVTIVSCNNPSTPNTSSENDSSSEQTSNNENTSSEEISSSEESSSENNSSSEVLETYTITWKNYDNSVLETDNDVIHGNVPTYDGNTPTKVEDNEYSYVFIGWTPKVEEATSNQTYTALFNSIPKNSDENTAPKLSSDKKTVQYGIYPQSRVKDATVIDALSYLEPEANGTYLYQGEYYVKESASTYYNSSYTFDDGTTIVNGTSYFFKCEPITWNVLSSSNGSYYVISSKLLDVYNYYNNYNNRLINNNIVYANSYIESDIRSWLNGYFYDLAFTNDNSFIQSTTVDNTASTTDASDNKYACESTSDKVYLPSYKDLLNSNYGFGDIASTRKAKTTDYARIKGAWVDTNSSQLNCGIYWTRSPSSLYSYCAMTVNTGGYLSAHAIDSDDHCVRPCITLTITK